MNTFASNDASVLGLVQWAGAHALPEFLALLALPTAVVLLLWSVRQLAGHPRRVAATAPDPTSVGASVALILFASLAFAGIAHEVRVGGLFVDADRAFLEAVRAGTSERTVQVFEWITLLGDGRSLAVLVVTAGSLLLLGGRRPLAAGLVLAVAGNGILNAILKRGFVRVRPPHEAGLPLAHGWSFPSGHSSGALVAYGMLAYVMVRLLPRRWHLAVVVTAIALVLSVGCSRIFLEAHYASDVLAGFCSGAAWLTACIAFLEAARRRSWPAAGEFGPAPLGAGR